jgi:hypothetical protein
MRAFELLPNTKRPAAPWLDSATWKPVESFAPEARYGLPCGPENGFFAIDLDNKDGNTGALSFSNWLEQRNIDLPPTRFIRTPGNGWHLYFVWPEGTHVGNRVGIFGRGRLPRRARVCVRWGRLPHR